MDESNYPEISRYLDKSGTMTTSFEEKTSPETGQHVLVVTQKSDEESDVQMFERAGAGWVPIVQSMAPAGAGQKARASSLEDHNQVFDYVLALLAEHGHGFSSATGPDGGNLACLWTVRHVVHDCLDRWITKTDGTEYFGQELKTSFDRGADLQSASNGWIVISPTRSTSTGRNIGHVGFIGDPSGDETKIYSNSSRRKRLEQNFSLSDWRAKYHGQKGLDVLFYPLPDYSAAATS